jgi:hypothetical protein
MTDERSRSKNKKSKGGFVLRTNMAHISKARCGAPVDRRFVVGVGGRGIYDFCTVGFASNR